MGTEGVFIQDRSRVLIYHQLREALWLLSLPLGPLFKKLRPILTSKTSFSNAEPQIGQEHLSSYQKT